MRDLRVSRVPGSPAQTQASWLFRWCDSRRRSAGRRDGGCAPCVCPWHQGRQSPRAFRDIHSRRPDRPSGATIEGPYPGDYSSLLGRVTAEVLHVLPGFDAIGIRIRVGEILAIGGTVFVLVLRLVAL